jgi:hypothetical protein
MTCDDAHNLVVLFGGVVTSRKLMNDTWTFDGQAWTQQPATSPPPRQQGGMAYDCAKQQVVLFSGIGQNGAHLLDTWMWNGTNKSTNRAGI